MLSKENSNKVLLDKCRTNECVEMSKSEMTEIHGGSWLSELGETIGCYVGSLLSSAEMDFVNSPIHGPNAYKYM